MPKDDAEKDYEKIRPFLQSDPDHEKVHEIYRKIFESNLLEDRLEYTINDLARMYDLDIPSAIYLYTRLHHG
jgi:hypothetical protein